MRKDDQLPPPSTATEDMFASPDPTIHSITGGRATQGITPGDNQSSQPGNTWMDSRIGISEGNLDYENDVDMWSQSDDTSLTE